MKKATDCSVEVSPQHRLGFFANAFRIVQADNQEECLLDFLVYSELGGKAQVIPRVRVRTSLLPDIRDRLNDLLEELP
jgi:hypothetical protein